MTRLVLRRQRRHRARARIRRVLAHEPQERQEAALAQHRQEEAGDREVGLDEQGRQRRLPARGRQPEHVAAQARAPGEHLEVARLVGDLDRQELHHLAEVRMQPTEEPRRHQQRRGLVLDQIRHHLHHRVLDLRRMIGRRVPRDRGRRIPLRRRGLGVEPRGLVGPHRVLVDERQRHVGGAGLDQRAARGQAPPRWRMIHRGVDRAGSLGAAPAIGGAALDHPRDTIARERIAPGPTPRRQIDRQGRRRAGDPHRRVARQAARHEQVRALVEAEVGEVDVTDGGAHRGTVSSQVASEPSRSTARARVA